MPNISNQDKSQTASRHGDNLDNSSKSHVTKDGQPDHRYKENRDDNQDDDQKSNQRSNQQSNQESEHMTKDGQPDHRYKENRDDQSSNDQKSNNGQQSSSHHDDSGKLADIPTKLDGTADMRYKESREAVAQGLLKPDEVVEEAMNGSDD
ncbi:unnamed protein product [Adineta steineri]|uniref:Uncharacterized protein n=1 Tax=Adineta steineri TaxID=433720 RepID=A0A814W9N4_9BILA|nr:unnamed protein product [Adineta steineri]CAF3712364.1 unnamed protein product [Adineta steineri]